MGLTLVCIAKQTKLQSRSFEKDFGSTRQKIAVLFATFFNSSVVLLLIASSSEESVLHFTKEDLVEEVLVSCRYFQSASSSASVKTLIRNRKGS
mmetsp:Transcript_4587/g.8745  ORF Transcript_4587/g.8745 Transcript_4587/m.8745 type:complete len:94 (+) Transcript_4587:263-544(+)